LFKVKPQAEKIEEEGRMSKHVQMLGAAFNFETMTVSVPPDKVSKAKHLIAVILALQWAPADLAQQALGVLVFLSRILLSAQWHLALTVRSSAVAVQNGAVHVSPQWRIELQWHDELYTHWNCAAMMVPREYYLWDQNAWETPASDASRSVQRLRGAAGMWYKQYYQAWEFDPIEIRDLHIMELEGFALVVWLEYLVRVHPDEISGKRYIIRCDNDPFVVAVNSRKSTQPAIALLIGIIHHWSALYHFDLRLVYIKSADNIGADALSRGNLPDYFDFMFSSYNISQAECIRVPVKREYRNWLSSAMRRSKLLPTAGLTPPTQSGGRRSWLTSGSAGTTNSNLSFTPKAASTQRKSSGTKRKSRSCATPDSSRNATSPARSKAT
jgi:hypothetical protein